MILKIRLATEKDRIYFINNYYRFYDQNTALAEKYAASCIDIYRSWVLYSEEEIIGSITWTIREGMKSGLVEIFQMSIAKPDNRRKGYGSMLVKHCLKDIEAYYDVEIYPLRRVYILINEDNLPGRNLYKNHGFRILTELKDHFQTGQKELMYVKDYF